MTARISDRIKERLAAYDALDDVYDQTGAHQWMHRTHRRLDGRTPAQAISDGDAHVVMQLIENLAGGPRA